jgi:serine protease Do
VTVNSSAQTFAVRTLIKNWQKFLRIKMHKRFLLVLCCFVTTRYAAAQDLISAIAKARPACVRMWGFDTAQQQRTSAQFSGVVVKGNYILTAAHVITPGNTYKVFFPDGGEAIAQALGKIELSEDKTRPDVALMKILKGKDRPGVVMSVADLHRGEPCISIAYPESLDQAQPTIRFGWVTEPLNSRGFIRSTALMEPGDSGGPLFNLNGELIGLHSAIEIPESANYDVPVNLYQKYWSALQEPVVYHNWPEKEDTIQKDNRTVSFTWPKAGAYSGTCVRITSRLNGKTQAVLATVIESLVVSKNSMVGDSVFILGKPGVVIARDKAHDLVLIRPAQKLRGLKIKETSNSDPGTILFAPVLDSVVTGILSGGPLDLRRITSAGFLGATPVHGSSPERIYFVRPGSPAAQHDIRAGDIAPGLNDSIAHHWPGDTLQLKLQRGSEILFKSIVLTYPPLMLHDHPADHFAGGRSQRRDGFRNVYSTDLILRPEQCGGPVFDAQNHFLGINIARFSRANSVLIGIQVIKDFVMVNSRKYHGE